MVTRNTQRFESLEQGLTELRDSLSLEVESAMSRAMTVFQQTLATQISESLEKAAEKLGGEFNSLTERVEGRIARARADHETMIGDQQRKQDRFQAEIRAALES